MSDVVLPSRDDTLVRASSLRIGGPAGGHTRSGAGWWTPMRVCLALTILASLLAFGRVAHCYNNGWTSGQYRLGCYSDIAPLYIGRGWSDGVSPFDSAGPEGGLEYPVLTVTTVAVTAWAADRLDLIDGQRGTPLQRTQLFFLLNALVLLSAWVVLTALTARAAAWRPWDAAMIAVLPPIILTGLINWDLIAATLATAGLLLFARDRPAWAGVLIGLGAATKLYPAFLLIPIFLIAWRRHDLRRAGIALAGAVVSWVVVNLPWFLLDRAGWWRFYELSRTRGASWGSLWYAASAEGWFDLTKQLNWLGPVLFGAICLGLLALTWLAPMPPRLGQLAFCVVAGFLLVNKVYSPQYVIWMAALLPLARPRWTAALVWAAAEGLYFVAIWAQLEGVTNPAANIPSWPHSYATVLRMAAELMLVALIVRDVLQPSRDAIRASAPAGAPDDPLWPGSADADDLVDGGRGEADVDVEGVPDAGSLAGVRQQE